MEIRKATKRDLPRLLDLYRQGSINEAKLFDSTITPHWTNRPHTKAAILKRFSDAKAIDLVVVVQNTIVGYLIGMEQPPVFYRIPQKTAELMAFFIEKKHRSAGIGSAMIAEFLTWCKKRNIEVIRLTVSAHNKKAIQFYVRHGFHILDTVMEINPKNTFFKSKEKTKKRR